MHVVSLFRKGRVNLVASLGSRTRYNMMQQDMIESILCWYVVKSCSMHTELGQPPFYRHKASRSPYLFPGYDSGFVQGTWLLQCLWPLVPWVRAFYASTDPANVIPTYTLRKPLRIQFQIVIQKSDTCTEKTPVKSCDSKAPKWTTKPTIQWFPLVEDLLRDQLPLDGSVWLLTLEPLVDKFAFLRVPWINMRPRGGRWNLKMEVIEYVMHVTTYFCVYYI